MRLSLSLSLQACRGDKHDEPATAATFDDVDSELKRNEVEVDASAVYTLPAGADFIMCYSVAEGEALDCCCTAAACLTIVDYISVCPR